MRLCNFARSRQSHTLIGFLADATERRASILPQPGAENKCFEVPGRSSPGMSRAARSAGSLRSNQTVRRCAAFCARCSGKQACRAGIRENRKDRIQNNNRCDDQSQRCSTNINCLQSCLAHNPTAMFVRRRHRERRCSRLFLLCAIAEAARVFVSSGRTLLASVYAILCWVLETDHQSCRTADWPEQVRLPRVLKHPVPASNAHHRMSA